MSDYIAPWTFVLGLVVIIVIMCSIVIFESREMIRVTIFGSRNTASPESNGGSATFEMGRDIPSLAGKVILITGAAGDLGRQTAVELARHGRPACIYIADLPRNEADKKAVIDSITREAYEDPENLGDTIDVTPRTDVRFVELDLTSFESIRACAAEFVAEKSRLDILYLNAGIIRVAPGTTGHEYEVQFGLNYLGHAVLSKLLLPTMLRTARQTPDADVRIVVVSSEGHVMAPKGGIQFHKLSTDCADMTYTQRYGQSKVALIGFARELTLRHPELKTVSVHPGRILTGMTVGLRKESFLARITAPIAPFLCVPVSVGIANHLWAATSSNVVSGTYYEPVGVPGRESTLARDRDLSRRLWEWTESELKVVKMLNNGYYGTFDLMVQCEALVVCFALAIY